LKRPTKAQRLSGWAAALKALRRDQIATDPRAPVPPIAEGDDALLKQTPTLYLSERLH